MGRISPHIEANGLLEDEMPCLFFCNVPEGVEWYPHSCQWLFNQVAKAADVPVEKVEIHIETTRYKLLKPSGELESAHGVHVFVEWYEGRDLEAKRRIARAVQTFLQAHGLGRGVDLTFRDSPGETFFYEGILVPGGLPKEY